MNMNLNDGAPHLVAGVPVNIFILLIRYVRMEEKGVFISAVFGGQLQYARQLAP